jgi:L-ascorbate metabolism protein UlaG (beta-lactamase superfamily)
MLLRAFDEPTEPSLLASALGLDEAPGRVLAGLFTNAPPARHWRAPAPGALRWRHFGHACVAVETAKTSVLVDPLVSHGRSPGAPARLSFDDLPATIDAVLITHNHQDHCTLETLLRIRHRIKRIVTPRALDSLEDPSLANALRRCGFANVIAMDEFERIDVGDIAIESFPFLGEHGDLRVSSKLTYKLSAHDKALFLAADSDCGEIGVYEAIAKLIGPIDVLFIGMECEGAPVSWLYGPLFHKPIARVHDQRRRLSGANAEQGRALVDVLKPASVYIYAMGEEPWVGHISAKRYASASLPMTEAEKLISYCCDNGLESERLVGCPTGILAR